jgi:hypothetical protein
MVGSEVVTGTASTGTSTAECAEPGSFLLGGGFTITGPGGIGSPSAEDDVLASQPNAGGTGWEAILNQLADGIETEIIAYAVCAEPPTP